MEDRKLTGKGKIQIDVSIERSSENGSGREQDENDVDDHSGEESISTAEPMIEMNVAVGNFDSNPIFSTLLGNDEKYNEDDSSVGCNVDDVCSNRISPNENSDENSLRCNKVEINIKSDNISSLKKGTSKHKSSPFLTERSTKRIKVLKE